MPKGIPRIANGMAHRHLYADMPCCFIGLYTVNQHTNAKRKLTKALVRPSKTELMITPCTGIT